MTPPKPKPWQDLALTLKQRWLALQDNERRALRLLGLLLLLIVVWLIAVQPALRTLRETPAQLEAADAQLQEMQALGIEARELRTLPPVPAAQATQALQAATDHLGAGARLTLSGDRAVLTLTGIDSAALRAWLGEARKRRARTAGGSAASARPQGLHRHHRAGAERIRPMKPFFGSRAALAQEAHAGEARWHSQASAARYWALAGALLGLLIALVAFAPASWLAQGLASASGGRLLVNRHPRQHLVGQRPARARRRRQQPRRRQPARPPALDHGPAGPGPAAPGQPGLLHQRGVATAHQARLQPARDCGGQPGRLADPLARRRAGRPGHPLEHAATGRLAAPAGPRLQARKGRTGRWRQSGQLDLDLVNLSSRVSTLAPLGSYRLSLVADPAAPGLSTMHLSTTEGALLLTGLGTLGGPGGKARFNGEASSAPGREAALDNLLNIIGRRQGARSVISIG